VGEAVLGIVANPLSGRGIRRLVAKASVFPTVEKANMLQRMLTAAGAVGVDRVLRGIQAHRRAFRPGRDSARSPCGPRCPGCADTWAVCWTAGRTGSPTGSPSG
jgi:hypothetical protein